MADTNLLEQRIIDLLKEGLDKNSNLAKTAKCIIDYNNNYWEISLLLEDYWKWVENGRGPGKQPPIDKIENWVRIKHIAFKTKNGTALSSKSTSFAIAKSISKKGTKGKYFLKHIQDNIGGLMNIITDIIIEKFNTEIEKEYDNVLE